MYNSKIYCLRPRYKHTNISTCIESSYTYKIIMNYMRTISTNWKRLSCHASKCAVWLDKKSSTASSAEGVAFKKNSNKKGTGTIEGRKKE